MIIDVGSVDTIKPGTMKRVETTEGKRLLICNVAGEFYAVDDMCTHEDASLYLGCLKGDEVQCSLHGGRFNVKTGVATVEPAEIPLATYDLTIVDQRIRVHYSQD